MSESHILDTFKSGLRALDLNKMQTEGFDVNQHHERMLSTGPFADAAARQSAWDHEEKPSDAPTTLNVDDAANELRQHTSGHTETGIDPNLGMDVREEIKSRLNDLQMGTIFGGATGNWGANQMSPMISQAQERAPIQPVTLE